MISRIKVYDGNGTLKKIIEPEDAQKLWDSSITLSRDERKAWNRMKTDEVVFVRKKPRQRKKYIPVSY
jgi:hypothetical protein|tara:strand:+ start:141 stop:344 length:204 start_codon:yes stop_codon:yes gene_type:complete